MVLSTVGLSVAAAILVQVIAWFWLKERLSRSIKYEYDKDLERLKHELKFELDRRKKLYEGKLAQYKRYYHYIDQYSRQGREELFSKYSDGLVQLLRNPSDDAFSKYMRSILDTQGDLAGRFLSFKTEMNGLRLEAGETLLGLLDEYTALLEEAQEQTVAFMTRLNSKLTQLPHEPDALQSEVQDFVGAEFGGIGRQLKELSEKIFREMRRELGVV